MANLSVKIEGLDELQKAFKKAPRLFTQIFDGAVKKSIYALLGTSREATPVDTGFLRGAGMVTSFEALMGTLENTAPYALFVHDGTKHMPARPFFSEGIDAGQDQVDNIFSDALEQFNDQI